MQPVRRLIMSAGDGTVQARPVLMHITIFALYYSIVK
jgi:hypothetical protein